MEIVSILRLFYIIYTAYTIFVMSVSNYSFFHAFFGLVSMWIIYFAFASGYKMERRKSGDAPLSNNINNNIPFFNVSEWKPLACIINVILCWIFVLLSARFYTGKSAGQVINALLNGDSLYISYQIYFKRNNIAAFSAGKIIYILMLTYVTIVFIYSFISIMLSDKKISIGKLLFLIAIGGSYLYFGLSRGTNIEMYMVFILLSYCILNRRSKNGITARRMKTLVIVGILGVVVIFLFRLVLNARGIVFQNRICEEISFNQDSLIAQLFPSLTNVGLSLFSYLGYGIYAIGVAISDIFLQSATNSVASLIPFGCEIFAGESLSTILKSTIEVGVRWVPDWINYVGIFGIPLFVVAIFIFGWITGKITTSKLSPMLINLCSVFIFLQMLSIPVGNFIASNTPTTLTIWFTIGCCLWSRFFKVFTSKMVVKL